MDLVLDILSWASIVTGTALCIVGGIGLLRLPDVFARMHGASIIDTLGLALILLGLGFQAGLNIVAIKLVLIFIFVLFTSPTTTHALAQAAVNEGVEPLKGSGASETNNMAEETGSSKT